MTGLGLGKGDFSDAPQGGAAAEDAAEDVVNAAEFAVALNVVISNNFLPLG